MLVKPDVTTSRPLAHLTKRSFLQAMGLAFACRLRPIRTGFTVITDDLVWLMRWCCFSGGTRYAGAG